MTGKGIKENVTWKGLNENITCKGLHENITWKIDLVNNLKITQPLYNKTDLMWPLRIYLIFDMDLGVFVYVQVWTSKWLHVNMGLNVGITASL